MDSYLDKRCRPYLRRTNDEGRVDETYVKVKGVWKYLYRAVDSNGNANPPYPPSQEGGQKLLRLCFGLSAIQAVETGDIKAQVEYARSNFRGGCITGAD